MMRRPSEPADDDVERATLTEMLQQARAMVTRLETALWRLDSAEVSETNPVRYWRKQRRMSQTDLARAVGVTPAAICRIEHSNHIAARPDTIKGIAAALDIPAEWLDWAEERSAATLESSVDTIDEEDA